MAGFCRVTLPTLRQSMSNELLACLAEGRRLHNQTVRDAAEIDAWHKQADALLDGTRWDDPTARWDAPARVEQREFVNRLFRNRL
jgi:hypothetical protein